MYLHTYTHTYVQIFKDICLFVSFANCGFFSQIPILVRHMPTFPSLDRHSCLCSDVVSRIVFRLCARFFNERTRLNSVLDWFGAQ